MRRRCRKFLRNWIWADSSGGSSDWPKAKSPAELCTVAGNTGNVKCLIKNAVTRKGAPPASRLDSAVLALMPKTSDPGFDTESPQQYCGPRSRFRHCPQTL